MQRNTRWLRLDICDYAGTLLCNLYDSSNEISGQANNIVVHTERNGYKEIRFAIPSTCSNEEGEERNYRLDYLISDYKIRIQSKKAYNESLGTDSPVETDWFFISESKVHHDNLSGDYEIQAKHVSQLLNTMNMDLEFSDEEGNNTGTIGEIALEVLGGTGWHLGTVAEFQEEDKYLRDGELVEKKRSFNASAKTGAFKMMSNLCEMFDAKPIYHGEGSYQGFNVEGTNLSNVEDSLYGEDYDIYEATKAKDKAEEAGWTDVVIVEGNILHGRTVDILPINPFSKDIDEGELPDTVASQETDVIELYYDKNIKNLTRVLNTDNLVTKLTSYGSFGDRNGACSLQKAEHALYSLSDVREDNPTGKLVANQEYRFLFPPNAENGAYFYFTPTEDITADTMKWSSLDFASRSYVYDGTHLYKTYKQSQEQQYITIEPTVTYEKNYFPFVMDFSYFQKIGLFNDEMYENLAEFQTSMPAKYKEAEEKAVDLGMIKSELSETASSGEGYLKFSVASKTTVDGNIVLTLDTSDPKHKDGVLYRSDYDEAKRNRFSWRTASGIKNNGTAIAGKGSVVYIINSSNPTTWVKAYVKALGNGTNFYYRDEYDEVYERNEYVHYTKKERVAGDDPNTISQFPASPASGNENKIHVADDTQKTYIWKDNDYVEVKASDFDYGLNEFQEPTTIMLWTSSCTLTSGTQVFMFSADSIAGVFGPREDSIISNKQAIEETVKVTTQTYPVYFIEENDSYPSTDVAKLGYGWLYRSLMGTENLWGALWFCWGTKPTEHGIADVDWGLVYVSRDNTNPETVSISTDVMQNYRYYYSTTRKKLYVRNTESGKWKPIGDSTDEKHVSYSFAAVVKAAVKHEVLDKGVREEYYHGFSPSGTLSAGNYAFQNEFGNYWLFTTDRTIDPSAGGQLRLKTSDKAVWQDNDMDHIVIPSEYSFDYVSHADANELSNTSFSTGGYSNHVFSSKGTKYISGNIPAYENVEYEFVLPTNSKVVCLTQSSKYISEFTTSPFTTPTNTYKIRVVCPDESHGPSSINNATLHVKGYDSCIFVKGDQYRVLSCTGAGDRLGMTYLMNKFLQLSNEAYNVALPVLQAAQEEILDSIHDFNASVGDMYREGYWQNNDYSEGDEDKLYIDSLDNIKEIAQPEATYEFTYLDLYKSERNLGLSGLEESEEIEYPDVDISCAAHLVDPEIDTNRWAYIDSIDKCYDQPWKTTMEINTRLSTIGQQSFTDVLSRIAEVANDVKAKQGIYKKANALTGSGKLAADRLEGAIQANRVYILGGTSNWWTDDKGNIIFEAADGSSAMMLSGQGWAISNTKDAYGDWNWRYMATGLGLTADAIYTGYLSASVIEAGSITADKLNASVGEELEISSNKALTLFATVDGERPAGSLLTERAGQNDSWIQIAAKDGNTEAFIAIKSGGKINIEGNSEINVGSDGAININGGEINIDSTGKLQLNSLSQIKIGNSDFGTEWDTATNQITQTVTAKIGRTFIQLSQPQIGQADPNNSGQTVTAFIRGDRWIAVDPTTLLRSSSKQSSGTSVTKYILRSKIKTETEDFDDDISDLIDDLNTDGTITNDSTSQFTQTELEYMRAVVIDNSGADVFSSKNASSTPIDHLDKDTDILISLDSSESWVVLEEPEEEQPDLSTRPVYIYNGSTWVLLSPEDDLVEMFTQIKQNESSIILNAQKTTKLTGDLLAALSVTADKITSVVGHFNSPTGRVSILEQTSDNILAGVTPVGALLTDGSYIEIEEDKIEVYSSGNLLLNSGAGMYLVQGGVEDPNNAITMTNTGMNIATKGILRLAAGSGNQAGGSLTRYDTTNHRDDSFNSITMTNAGMNIKTTGVLDISAGGGIYLYNTDSETGDATNAIVMSQQGMNISTQGTLTINPNKLILTTTPVTNGGSTLASQLTFLSGRIESTVVACTSVVYEQSTDPYDDPEIRPLLKMGDYWVVSSSATDWSEFGIESWLEQHSQTWGDYAGDCPVYCWSGERWVLVNDPSFISTAFSRITQAEDLIQLEVGRMNDIEGVLTTRISQTADEISLYAQQQDTALHNTITSEISVSAGGVLLEAKQYTDTGLGTKYTEISNIEITSAGVAIRGSKFITMDSSSNGVSLHAEMSSNKIEFSAGNTVTKMARNLFSTVVEETNNGITTQSKVEITPTKVLLESQSTENGQTTTSTVRINANQIYMATRGDVRLLGSTTSIIKFYDEGVTDSSGNVQSSCLISQLGVETFFLRAGAAKIGNLEVTGNFSAPFIKTLPNVVVSDTQPSAGKRAIWIKPVRTSQSATNFSGTASASNIGQHACDTSSSGGTYSFTYSTHFSTPFSLQDVSSLTVTTTVTRAGQDFYKTWNVKGYLVCSDGTNVPLGTDGYVTANPPASQYPSQYYYRGSLSISSTATYDGTARTALGIKYILSTADSFAHYSSFSSTSISYSGSRTSVIDTNGLCEVRYIP